MKVNSGQAPSTLIPEYLGSDFDKVAFVAENLEYVKQVAEGIAGMSVKSYAGPTPPKLPVMGSEWYCTTDGRTYIWYEDEDSSPWVESSPQSTNDGLLRDLDTILDPKYKQIFEALRRSYAEAGYTLVNGSFEKGGTLTSATDVLLYEKTGKAYSYDGEFPKIVEAASVLITGTGFVMRSDVGLRDEITNSGEFSATDAGYKLSSISRCVSEFGASGLGIQDDTAALQSAIDWAGSGQGRRIYGRPGDKYRITAGLVLRFDSKEMDEASSAILDFSGTTIIPDADNITCLKVSRNYAVVVRPKVDNKNSRGSITAYALAPEDETQTALKVWQMYCEFHSPVARGCSTAFRFRPGPTVVGSNSGSFYHDIYNPRFHNCGIGFHFARSVSGDNLTTRVNVFAPKHVFGHCAWDIEAADSLNVYGGSAEFIKQSGAHSGNPTIKVHKPVAGDALSTSNICFYRYYGEAGTTPFDISMRTEQVSMPGCTFFGYQNNGLNNGSYTLQNMFQNEGAIVSRAKYSTGSTAMLAVRRDVGANQGQAYLRYMDAASYPAEFYADRGFTFASPIRVARIADLQNTATNSQVIGSSLARVDISGSPDTGTALFYNTSSLNGRAIEFGGVYSVGPSNDNWVSAGRPAARYSTVYAVTGTINTSDGRDKTPPMKIDDNILDAWGDVQLIAFQWLSSVAEKGELARWHFGVIAQQIKDAFAKKGIDGVRYGLLCYDKWDDAPAIINGEGVEVVPARMAGDRWGIRADQCLFLEAAYQRRRCDRIEARLASLESK